LSSRKKRIFLILGLACAVLILAFFIAHLEPFAPRYKGKTVNHWLTFYVQESEKSGETKFPVDDIITEFGTNALPVLTENTKYRIGLERRRRLIRP
jgi:hypothetical protein